MSQEIDAIRKSRHGDVNPSIAFLLCLFAGPLGLLCLGMAETLLVGTVFLAGAGLSYLIWPVLIPGFIGFGHVLLAFAAARGAVPGTGPVFRGTGGRLAKSRRLAMALDMRVSFASGQRAAPALHPPRFGSANRCADAGGRVVP